MHMDETSVEINEDYAVFAHWFSDALRAVANRRRYSAKKISQLTGIELRSVEKHLSGGFPSGPHLHRYLNQFRAELANDWLSQLGMHVGEGDVGEWAKFRIVDGVAQVPLGAIR